MFTKIQEIFSIPELKRRVLFTLGLLVVYRVGSHITTPGVDSSVLTEFFERQRGTILGLYDLFAGGNLEKATIFALGIMPYISASIILQLFQAVIPYFEKLAKEGEEGRKKITQYTRYGTVVLSVIQAFGIAIFLESMQGPSGSSRSSSSVAPCICPERPMPRTAASACACLACNASTARSAAASQSRGFCSDQPGCGRDSSSGAELDPTTACASSISVALTADVPRSSPRYIGARLARRGGQRERVQRAAAADQQVLPPVEAVSAWIVLLTLVLSIAPFLGAWRARMRSVKPV